MTDSKAEKPKASRGITARLPEHTLAEMREANQDLNMPLEVLREIVDAHVAGSLPPGKVTELVVARRRKDDEAMLAKRTAHPPTPESIELMKAMKESLLAPAHTGGTR